MRSDTLSISRTAKDKLPRVPFLAMKNAVLGKSYRLSIAIVRAAESERLNRLYRRKQAPTDILSFPLDAKTGEIILCLRIVRREAKKFGRSFENFLGYLVIHGLLHLKGFTHGSTMEAQERKFRKKFGI